MLFKGQILLLLFLFPHRKRANQVWSTFVRSQVLVTDENQHLFLILQEEGVVEYSCTVILHSVGAFCTALSCGEIMASSLMGYFGKASL